MTRDLVQNPAWATRALSESWDGIAKHVPGKWLPHFESIKAAKLTKGRGIEAELKEYGCGVYGCVWPTNDPGVVMKLTTDDTEAEFASMLADTLVAPVCVKYYTVYRLGAGMVGKDQREMYLLWRESADSVGEIGKVKTIGGKGVQLINEQKWRAHLAFETLKKIEREGETPALAERLTERVYEWQEAVTMMTEHSQLLQEWGRGLLKVWTEQRILFGDAHAGNVGIVHRADRPGSPDGKIHLVITDPGHVSVVNLRLGSGV